MDLSSFKHSADSRSMSRPNKHILRIFLKAEFDLDFLPTIISITDRAADKNYTELSSTEMSIIQINFKIQCSFKISFQNNF